MRINNLISQTQVTVLCLHGLKKKQITIIGTRLSMLFIYCSIIYVYILRYLNYTMFYCSDFKITKLSGQCFASMYIVHT